MPISEFKTAAWQSKESAEHYHARTAGAHRLFQLVRHELFVRYIERHAPSGSKILDLGCGSGLLSTALCDRGYNVVACDVSRAMLDKLEAWKGSRAIETRLGSGFQIPASDGEFDVVVSRMFLPHFPEWPNILKEKARVTRRGGIVLFDFGNREHIAAAGNGQLTRDFPYHADTEAADRFYAVASEEEMARVALANGLEVISILPHGFLLNNAHLWNAVGSRGVQDFYDELDRILINEQARKLILFIEEHFVSRGPKDLAYGNITILRKT